MRGATVKLLRKTQIFRTLRQESRWWHGMTDKERSRKRFMARRDGLFRDGKWKRKLRALREALNFFAPGLSWWVIFDCDMRAYWRRGRPISGVQWMKTAKGPRPSGPWKALLEPRMELLWSAADDPGSFDPSASVRRFRRSEDGEMVEIFD